MITTTVIGVVLLVLVRANSFPSLLLTNATLAIVIDREFLTDDFDHVKTSIETYIANLRREVLKHGGINVQYYTWANINIKREVAAILSVASCFDTWRLFKAADEENVLHIAISESDCPRLPLSQAITIPLIRTGEEMPQMLLDLRSIKAYDWKSAVILFDDTLDRDMITRVLTSLTKDTSNVKTEGSAVSLIKLDVGPTSSKTSEIVMKTLSTISTKVVGLNFVVIVSMDLVVEVLKAAKTLEMVGTKSQWLYIMPNPHRRNVTDLKTYLQEGDNVAFIYNITSSDSSCKGGLVCHVGEVLRGFCEALDQAIVGEYELASQVSDEEWEAIRPTKAERMMYLINMVKSYLFQRGECGNCTTWQLKTGETWGRGYNNSAGFSAELLQVGYWRPSDGPTLTDALFPHVVHGFRGKSLPLVSLHNPPWQILGLDESGRVVSYRGLVFDIINQLGKSLNFTYTVEVIRENSTEENSDPSNRYDIGNITTYAIPDDVIKQIRTKQVALAACAFTITEHSKTMVNFTIPISIQAYTFLVARPKELSRALLFMSPFTKGTWLCLSATIIAMGPLLYFVNKFTPVHEYKGIRLKEGLSSVLNCIWYMYGAILQQGGMYLPQAGSARILIGSWWLVVLVLSTTYCGNLVAFLTFPKMDKPINTLDELLAHRGTVTWSMMAGGFFEREIKISTEPKLRAIYEGAVKNITNDEEMIRDVEGGRHVLIDWRIRLQYIMKKQLTLHNRCELALGNDEFFDEQLGLVLSQHNPYISIINEKIKRLHQVGLIQKWLRDYLPKKDKCFNTRNLAIVNNHTVNLIDMQGSFFVLIFGFTLAFLSMCVEKLWHRYKLRQEKKVVQPFAT